MTAVWLGEFKGERSGIHARACAHQSCGQYRNTYMTRHALGPAHGFEVFASDDDSWRPDLEIFAEHHMPEEREESEVEYCPCCGQTIKGEP